MGGPILPRLLSLAAAMLAAAGAWAHPLGNFSINQYFLLDVRGEPPSLYYLADIAEIPSFTELDLLDSDFNSEITEEEVEAYLDAKVPELAAGVSMAQDGRTLDLALEDRRLALLPGAGGMVVFNIVLRFSAADFQTPETGERTTLRLSSENYPEDVGVRELKLASGGRYRDATGRPEGQRVRYQQRMLAGDSQDPVYQNLSANFELTLERADVDAAGEKAAVDFGWTSTAQAAAGMGETAIAEGLGEALEDPAAGAAEPADDEPAPMLRSVEGAEQAPFAETPGGASRPDGGAWMDRVSELIRTKRLTWPMLALGLAIAALMGMSHALAPGHGKTVMAAYLIGERGTYWHAVILGLVVTITHTWSVLLLGVVILYAREYVSEEQVQFWSGVVSGAIIMVLGVVLFIRRYTAYVLAQHGADGLHHPSGAGHSHLPPAVDEAGAPPSYWSILWLGISGGIVPCHGALIVLLLAIKFGKLAYGLWLLVAFSLGLAAVLVAIGIVVVRTAGAVRSGLGDRSGLIRALPVFASILITALGGWVVLWTLIQFDVVVLLPEA